jgi:hypothetical protein
MREYRTPGHGREHDGDMSSMSKNKIKLELNQYYTMVCIERPVVRLWLYCEILTSILSNNLRFSLPAAGGWKQSSEENWFCICNVA